MPKRLRTPVLAMTLASISLLGLACGDDDGNDLDDFPTTAANPTQDSPDPNDNGNTPSTGSTPGGESPQPEPEGEIGGNISAEGDVQGDFVPQSALATVEGDLQVLLASATGESVALMVEGDGAVTMESYSAEQEVVLFTGSGAEVETAGDGSGVCGVQLGGTELTGADGGNVQLNGELIITGANC